MNNKIQIFQNEEFGTIRTTVVNEEPWFVAADVCRVLDIKNPTDAMKRLDDDEKAMLNLGLRGGETNCVNEPGLYSLVLGSRKPEARAFKRWVTHDVIPTIRKHGAYMTPDTIEKVLADPDTIIRLATELKEARAERDYLAVENKQQAEQIGALEGTVESQRQTIEDYKPKVDYLDTILSCPDAVTTTQIAADYDISANRLNKILHEEGLQRCVGGQWILYHKHMGKGYTKSETFQFKHRNGRPGVTMQTKWTQKGRVAIYEILKARGITPVMDMDE